MISDYEYVDILFENCDYVKIYPKDIEFLLLEEIKDNIHINCVGQIIEFKTCDLFSIQLNNKALKTKTRFGIGHFDDIYTNETFQDYIDDKNITRIVIKFNDGREEDISVPFESERIEGPNECQRNVFAKRFFRITCARNKELLDKWDIV